MSIASEMLEPTILTVDSLLVTDVGLNGNNLASSLRPRRGVFGSLLEDITASTGDVYLAAILSEGSRGDEAQTASPAGDCEVVDEIGDLAFP